MAQPCNHKRKKQKPSFKTGCLRKIEKINICIKLTKMKFLVTDENMGLCLYMSRKKGSN